jgi:gluconolactonase
LDHQGNVYVAGGWNPIDNVEVSRNKAGIYIFSPKGDHIGFIPIPENAVTNCCFGGAKGNVLFITAGKTLYKINTNVIEANKDEL